VVVANIQKNNYNYNNFNLFIFFIFLLKLFHFFILKTEVETGSTATAVDCGLVGSK
jgi:hypothetical protein